MASTTVTQPLKIYVIAGEVSGDSLAAELLEELHKLTFLQSRGICGPSMRKHNISEAFPMETLQVMGFMDILLALPKFYRLFKRVKKDILEYNPQCVIFVDYPGFNLRMAASLRKSGYKGKLIHYVCPSVWAWGKKRISKMISHLDLLLSLLPFEKEIFAKTPLRVEYVGHPLTHKIAHHRFQTPSLFSASQSFISIFPGSRLSEVQRNFPDQIAAAISAAKSQRIPIAISFAHSTIREKLKPIVDSFGLQENKEVFFVPAAYRYELMQQTYLAIATSGTITLELALLKVPTVITYALKKFDQLLAQYIFRIHLPFYTLPNIIAGKEVFHELVGPYYTLRSLEKCLHKLMDPNDRALCIARCGEIEKQLKRDNASRLAANAIMAF